MDLLKLLLGCCLLFLLYVIECDLQDLHRAALQEQDLLRQALLFDSQVRTPVLVRIENELARQTDMMDQGNDDR